MKISFQNPNKGEIMIITSCEYPNDLSYFEKVGNIFFVIDTETTGFSRSNADAIEISALKVGVTKDGFEVLDTFDTYINPNYPLPKEIVEFNERNHTGVTDKLLAKSPSKIAAAQDFVDFIGKDWKMKYVVGHNLPFDVKFIDKLLNETNVVDSLRFTQYDTLSMSREHLSGSHKLCDVFEFSEKKHTETAKDIKGFHNSLADCYATLDVLEFLKNEFYTQNTRPLTVKKSYSEYER